MEFFSQIVDFIVYLDKYIGIIIDWFGSWAYVILFVVVFCETGLVVTPFLPGDSLLFIIGALAAKDELNLWIALAIFLTAAVFGDAVNYQIGKFFGCKLFTKPNANFLKKENLEKTHKFYEKYGGKTIIIARFVPIIRTFAPFIAGMGSMVYKRFFIFNVIGAILWVLIILFSGFFFGNIPVIKDNFTFIIFAIIFISLLPAIINCIIKKRKSKKENKEEEKELDND